jgi:hypothetical protein
MRMQDDRVTGGLEPEHGTREKVAAERLHRVFLSACPIELCRSCR